MSSKVFQLVVKSMSGVRYSGNANQLLMKRKATTSSTGAFLPEPEKQSYGLFGVTATMLAGLFIGATISQNIASFLEENELFVPSDDDDDDD